MVFERRSEHSCHSFCKHYLSWSIKKDVAFSNGCKSSLMTSDMTSRLSKDIDSILIDLIQEKGAYVVVLTN